MGREEGVEVKNYKEQRSCKTTEKIFWPE
jgi:hypothetical protein